MVAHFCPSRLWVAQICCALEQHVFFYAVFWHCALFLYTLVLHPTTTPDIQRFAGYGYFYWKMTNVYKLLFSPCLSPHSSSHSFLSPPIPFSFSFFLFFRDKGSKLLGISWKHNAFFACAHEMFFIIWKS